MVMGKGTLSDKLQFHVALHPEPIKWLDECNTACYDMWCIFSRECLDKYMCDAQGSKGTKCSLAEWSNIFPKLAY